MWDKTTIYEQAEATAKSAPGEPLQKTISDCLKLQAIVNLVECVVFREGDSGTGDVINALSPKQLVEVKAKAVEIIKGF